MDYVLLDFSTYKAYQESDSGFVTRYLDEQGNVLPNCPPEGHGGTPIDPNPPRQGWMM